MSAYSKFIQECTNCSIIEVPIIEEIMREDILHSTLDWCSQQQLATAARQAVVLLQQERTAYEEFYPQLKIGGLIHV